MDPQVDPNVAVRACRILGESIALWKGEKPSGLTLEDVAQAMREEYDRIRPEGPDGPHLPGSAERAYLEAQRVEQECERREQINRPGPRAGLVELPPSPPVEVEPESKLDRLVREFQEEEQRHGLR